MMNNIQKKYFLEGLRAAETIADSSISLYQVQLRIEEKIEEVEKEPTTKEYLHPSAEDELWV